MSLVALAATSSLMSFVTGIIAVGTGAHFQFKKMDILRGRRDAILYIWVIFSSIFALAHCASLLDYGLTYDWGYRNPDSARWMIIHTGVGILLTTAHLFIKGDLKGGGSSSIYLWGKHRG